MPSVTLPVTYLPIKNHQKRAGQMATISELKSHFGENKRTFHKSYEVQETVEHSWAFTVVAFAV